jgi:hypothetical protein
MKPRIIPNDCDNPFVKQMGAWCCSGNGAARFGDTPLHAYNKWLHDVDRRPLAIQNQPVLQSAAVDGTNDKYSSPILQRP